MKVFFSVGEPSGDLHGANLINQLRRKVPNLQAVGYGGPRMRAAGCELHEDLTALAIMWFLRVLLNIRTFWKLLWRADAYFRDQKPDAVILIDYPGFNWWIARRAKARRIPVYYYGTPQMWAWAGWRVRKMRRFVDHVLCKLPFEVDWYAQRGCKATFVGHPYFDELETRKLDREFVDSWKSAKQPLITILPGSRLQEVQSNLKSFLKTAGKIKTFVPHVRFAVAAFNESQANVARQWVAKSQIDAQVFVGRTAELIESAHSCLACSGSVSLELLFHEKPAVIHYRVARAPYFAQGFFRKVKYITLANLLATEDRYCSHGEVYDPQKDQGKVPFPEYLTCVDRTQVMADHIITWLRNDQEYAAVQEQLRNIKKSHVFSGASEKAANHIVQSLKTTELFIEAA